MLKILTEDDGVVELELTESSKVLKTLLSYINAQDTIESPDFDLSSNSAWDVIRASAKYEVRFRCLSRIRSRRC